MASVVVLEAYSSSELNSRRASGGLKQNSQINNDLAKIAVILSHSGFPEKYISYTGTESTGTQLLREQITLCSSVW